MTTLLKTASPLRLCSKRTCSHGLLCPTCWLFLHLLFSAVVPVAPFQGTRASTFDENLECNLYIAESTIPNAGLGIFTAIERQKGDTVGEGDVCIPLIDLEWHHPDSFYPFSEYAWAGEVMGMKFEAMTADVEALCPGLDCAINCNLALINVDKATPVYDEAGLHRARDPAAGSITPYHNGTTVVTRRIPPGGELFKFYGDSWFLTRTKDFGNIPLTTNYTQAEQLLKSFNKTVYILESRSRVNGKDQETNFQSTLYDLLVELRSIWDSRTLNALPTTLEEAGIALEHDIGEIYQQNATRRIEFLQAKGRCADHITWGYSTLPGSGRGAFAKRDLREGTIITGSPLHHIPQKGTLIDMYDHNMDKDEEESQQNVIARQPIVNYCFGHPDSSILLFPYGVGVNYINHQKDANVKIQWAKQGSLNQDDSLLRMDPIQLENQTTSRLAFEYIATRDIYTGEEMFLNYGDDWEKAWEAHQQSWKESVKDEKEVYSNAHEYNKRHANARLKTSLEVLADPYPTNLQIRCHVHLVDKKAETWRNSKKTWDWTVKDYGFPCTILERYDNFSTGVLYTVELTTEPQHRWDNRVIAQMKIDSVPRAAVRFFDVMCSTDMHLQHVFRHPIGLPTEMLPDSWRYGPQDFSTFPQDSSADLVDDKDINGEL